MTQHSVPLVGRDDALQRLDTLLRRAEAGSGGVVLVGGEAGIGKTRLCAELGGRHRARGGRVLLGRGAPEESTILLAPVADALRGARRADPPLWEAVQARADVLAAITPELLPADRRRAADRPVLFEALLDAVEESARGAQPTLWVLDDLQWADEATWHFVRYAARRVLDMSLLLAVTYRDEEVGPASPWWTGLVRLKREPQVETCALRRLGPADASRLVDMHAPTGGAAVRAQILERSAGTPLLIEELARLAGDGRELPAVPDVVRATARARAARLREDERELLDVAAVAGLAVDAQILTAVRPGTPADALVAASLLERDGAGYRFRHPLLHDAVLAELPAERARVLHEELADALAEGGAEAAERVAGHLERAGRPDAALAVLERGAQAGEGRGDMGRCATLALAAFRLACNHSTLADRRPVLERQAIEHLYRARRWTELDPLIRTAWLHRDRLSVEDRAALAGPLVWQLFAQGRIGESWEVIQEELGDAEAAGERVTDLHSQAAYLAWLRGDAEEARRHVERSLDNAHRASDRHAAWWAQHFRVHIDYRLTGDRKAAVAALRDSIAAAGMLRISDGEALAWWDLACHTARRDDIAAGRKAAERAGAASTLQDFGVLEGALLLLEGHVDEAESLFVRLGSVIRAGEPVSAPWIDVSQAMLHLHRGDTAAARAAVHGQAAATEAAATEYHLADRAVVLGWLAWENGRWKDAAEHLGRSLRLWTTGCWPTLAGGPFLLPLHVDALLRLGRAETAAAVVAEAPDGDGTRFYAAALAAARFRMHPDNERAGAALTASATAPWPWLSALVLTWRGELLGDRDAATEAEALSRRIGARSGAVRAERELQRFGLRPAEDGERFGPLSKREVDVARLVATGLSNPAIASRLYLSRPTVATHVSHILTKLGFSARSQIAAWVTEHDRLHPS